MENEEIEVATPAHVKKEKLALCISSVMNLGRELGPEHVIKLCMYLNVPTTKLVLDSISAAENSQEDSELAANLLLIWRTLRVNAKDNEKAKELERALRSIGKEELADIFIEKYHEDIELVSEIFPQKAEAEE